MPSGLSNVKWKVVCTTKREWRYDVAGVTHERSRRLKKPCHAWVKCKRDATGAAGYTRIEMFTFQCSWSSPFSGKKQNLLLIKFKKKELTCLLGKEHRDLYRVFILTWFTSPANVLSEDSINAPALYLKVSPICYVELAHFIVLASASSPKVLHDCRQSWQHGHLGTDSAETQRHSS